MDLIEGWRRAEPGEEIGYGRASQATVFHRVEMIKINPLRYERFPGEQVIWVCGNMSTMATIQDPRNDEGLRPGNLRRQTLTPCKKCFGP